MNFRKTATTLLASTAVILLLAGCAGRGGAGEGLIDRPINSTLDEVNEARDIPDGLVFVVESTTAEDAADDVKITLQPWTEGTTLIETTSITEWLNVNPIQPQPVHVDFLVESYDTTNAEVRCAVYYNGKQLLKEIAQGSEPTVHCEADFTAEELTK